MRTLTTILLVSFVLVSFTLFAAETNKVDFSGEWSLNEDKSDFGESRWRRAPSKVTIAQKENDLTITRVSAGRDGGERVTTEKYTLDGKACKNEGFRNQVKESTVKWAEDSKSLIISSVMIFERDGDEFEITTTETLKISEDGKTLSIDVSSTSPRGDRKVTQVFDKAEKAK